MKIIKHEDILALDIKYEEIFEWIKESFNNKEKVELPTKTSITQPGHIFYNIMPSLNSENEVAGVKVVTRYPTRTPSLDSQIYLYDTNNARLQAILDGNYITAMRTGAVVSLAIELLAKDDFDTIAIMGLGVTATAIMKMLTYTLRDKKIKIKLLSYKGQEIEFIKRFEKYEHFEFIISHSHKDLISNSDVVISSITYTDDFISEIDWYKEGVLLLPVHVMGFGNIYYLFDKVYMDDYGHLSHLDNFDRFKNKGELSDILTGKSEGRISEKEKIISYNIGLSMHDILFAKKIYEKNKNVKFEEIKLNKINTKYWL